MKANSSLLLRPFSGVYNDVFKSNREVSQSSDPINRLHPSLHLVKQLIFSTAVITAATSIVASVVIVKLLKK
jgi:hypothetical protein